MTLFRTKHVQFCHKEKRNASSFFNRRIQFSVAHSMSYVNGLCFIVCFGDTKASSNHSKNKNRIKKARDEKNSTLTHLTHCMESKMCCPTCVRRRRNCSNLKYRELCDVVFAFNIIAVLIVITFVYMDCDSRCLPKCMLQT